MVIDVYDNAERSRYEIAVDGRVVGVADYRSQGDEIVFPHTEIEPSMRGEGLGDKLVRGALDDVRTRGATVVPQCWHVAQFVDENPEYADLVAGS
jgi:uncharacterized protein